MSLLLGSGLGGKPVASTFSGSLSGIGGSSSVLGITRTYNMSVRNTGKITFSNIVNGGAGLVQYRYNGGSFTTFTDGTILTMAASSTLQVRATDMASGNTAIFDVVDTDTGTVIEAVLLERA